MPNTTRPRPIPVMGKRPCDIAQERLNQMGKTQIWLAEQTGYTPKTINVYLRGKKYFVYNPDLTRKVCRALQIPIEQLYKTGTKQA